MPDRFLPDYGLYADRAAGDSQAMNPESQQLRILSDGQTSDYRANGQGYLRRRCAVWRGHSSLAALAMKHKLMAESAPHPKSSVRLPGKVK